VVYVAGSRNLDVTVIDLRNAINKMETNKEGVLGKVAAANIRLLIERQKSGKPLTRAQLQQVENYFGKDTEQKTTWAKSMAELAATFSVSRTAIKLWLTKGAPSANSSGFYPIEAWKEWVAAHGAGGAGDEEDLDKSRLTARQVHLKNQKLEIELQRMRGEVMHRDEIRTKLFQTFDTCRRLQLRIGPAIAGRIAGMSPVEISKEITQAIRETYVEIQRWADQQSRAQSGDDSPGELDPLREERKETRRAAGRKDRRVDS
jgi:hypothetical protein